MSSVQGESSSLSSGSPAIEPSATDVTRISGRKPSPIDETAAAPVGAALQDALIGRRLHHFHVRQCIGRGGMGAVFLARDESLQRDVALKVLGGVGPATEEAATRFRQEAQAAARMHHPNIAQVHYFGEEGDVCFMAAEFVSGPNLRDHVIEHGPLDPRQAVRCARQVAEALAHIESQGIVHRDVKPANIVGPPDGLLKLVDLGLARMTATPQEEDLTASDTTLGTYDYLSPEQARDPRRADARSDLYSLGCTLFYLLTGRPPFPDGNPLQKMLQHQGEPPPGVRQFRPEVPEELSRILDRLLAKRPEQRYQRARDLIGDLATLSGADAEWLWTPFEEAHVEEEGSRWGVWIPIAATLAAAVVLVIPDPPPGPLQAGRQEAPPLFIPTNRAAPSESPPQNAVAAEAEQTGPVNPPTTVEPTVPVEESEPASENLLNRIPLASSNDENKPWLQTLAERMLPAFARRAGGSANDESANSPPIMPRRLIVTAPGTPVGPDEIGFSDLNEAVASSADGDVIELRFDGPLRVRPFRIEGQAAGRAVTIRGAPSMRPVLLFDGLSPSGARAMIDLDGADLTLINVICEANVAGGLTPRAWSFIRCRPGDRVVVKQSAITLGGARSADECAIFTAATNAGGDPAAELTVESEFDCQDVILRSSGSVLGIQGPQGVSLTCANAFTAAVSFISSTAQWASQARDPVAKLQLRSVTSYSEYQFYRGRDPMLNGRLLVDVRAADSIFCSGGMASFVELSEGADLNWTAEDDFRWTTEHSNFFHNVDPFLVIWRGASQIPYTLETAPSSVVGVRPLLALDSSDFDSPPPPVAVQELRPTDFQLNKLSAYNPAVDGASDGGDAGYNPAASSYLQVGP